MCQASSNQLKALRKRLTSLEEKKSLPPDSFQTQAAPSTLSWVSSLPAFPKDFGMASLHNSEPIT